MKDGKTSVLYASTFHADGGLYEFAQFAKSEQEDTLTDRGEVVHRFEIGQKVLFKLNPPMRDKGSKRAMVDKIYGKVLDVAR